MDSKATFEHTPLDVIDSIHARLRAGFASKKLRSIAYRKEQLSQLSYLLSDNKEAIAAALREDLGRPEFESDVLETSATLKEAVHAYNHVEKWAKPEKLPFDLMSTPMRPVIRKEAKGVVLIISPFNYPAFLALGPLAGAIASGNACVIKPSELAPATARLFADLFARYLDPDLYAVVNGAIPETTRLLELKWDHILYTGGDRVAKVVSAAAAKTLTPVTLELGGKSPAWIDPSCDLKSTARKLLWGKVSNAGQTCVAPDYALVPRHFQDALLTELRAAHAEFFPGEDARATRDFGRIVSPGHYARIAGLLLRSEGRVVIGGLAGAVEAEKYIPPTVIADVKDEDALMSEELFAPVLPIVPVEDVDEALRVINEREHPLALYYFGKDAAVKAKIFDNTQSGSAVANDVIVQIGVENLPFGGIGSSGSGQHTGKFSFDMFTHQRSSLDAPGWLDVVLNNRYPPYTSKKLARLAPGIWPTLPPRVGDSAGWLSKRVKLGLFTVVLALWGFVTARRAGRF